MAKGTELECLECLTPKAMLSPQFHKAPAPRLWYVEVRKGQDVTIMGRAPMWAGSGGGDAVT